MHQPALGGVYSTFNWLGCELAHPGDEYLRALHQRRAAFGFQRRDGFTGIFGARLGELLELRSVLIHHGGPQHEVHESFCGGTTYWLISTSFNQRICKFLR